MVNVESGSPRVATSVSHNLYPQQPTEMLAFGSFLPPKSYTNLSFGQLQLESTQGGMHGKHISS